MEFDGSAESCAGPAATEQASADSGEQPSAGSEPRREVARAGRFVVRLPIRYRPVGETQWQEGHTENVSSSGVLFRANTSLDLSTRIEMIFSLGDGLTAGTGQVMCSGRIVRTMPVARGADARPALAASIRTYRLMRRLELS